MATRRAPVGLAHPTVVPTNFDPDASESESAAAEADSAEADPVEVDPDRTARFEAGPPESRVGPDRRTDDRSA